MAIYTFNNWGYEGALVAVEADLRRGISAVDIVGLCDNTVAESRERIRSAIINSGFEFPKERVLLSLSPADLKKEGAGFDLPLALSILSKAHELEKANIFCMGELILNGEIKGTRGVYSGLEEAKKAGIEYAIIPATSDVAPEGILVARVKDLKEAK